MNRLQTELQTANPDFNIELLGVNWDSQPTFNPLVTSGRTLPWLQDNVQALVKFSWNAVYRDVRILDPHNRLAGVFNLTDHDLGVEANYLALKQMLLAAAVAADADADKLPDAWEERYFSGPRNAHPGDDPDHDGANNFTELAFGTDPKDASSRPTLNPRWINTGAARGITLVLRRPAGAVLKYVFATSPDLATWTEASGELTSSAPVRNRFDGSGTVEAGYAWPPGASPGRFLRVQALPRSQ